MSKFPGEDPLPDLLSVDTDRSSTIEASCEELRGKLEETRRWPGCPKGDDKAILAMSYPPYYTACPNPFIAQWLEDARPP